MRFHFDFRNVESMTVDHNGIYGSLEAAYADAQGRIAICTRVDTVEEMPENNAPVSAEDDTREATPIPRPNICVEIVRQISRMKSMEDRYGNGLHSEHYEMEPHDAMETLEDLIRLARIACGMPLSAVLPREG